MSELKNLTIASITAILLAGCASAGPGQPDYVKEGDKAQKNCDQNKDQQGKTTSDDCAKQTQK